MIITTGIFWVVQGEILGKKHFAYFEEAPARDFIDFPRSHFEVWDSVNGGKYPHADFSRFPRGRLLYKRGEGKYYLYLDCCITEEQTDKLVAFYKLEPRTYVIARDEHYRCDACMRRRRGKDE